MPFFNGAFMSTEVLESFTITNGNGKLNKNKDKIAAFGLLAGTTCPGACKCLGTPIKQENGKIKVEHGSEMEFPCFAAKLAALRPNVFKVQEKNQKLIEKLKPNELVDHFVRSFYSKAHWDTKYMRWFWSGDCYSIKLRNAVFQVAREVKHVIHYSYTKNLPIFIDQTLPKNYRLTASHGGKFDSLIHKFKRTAKVFATEELALVSGLPIDNDETFATSPIDRHFALIQH